MAAALSSSAWPANAQDLPLDYDPAKWMTEHAQHLAGKKLTDLTLPALARTISLMPF
jgi:hypothetical protein